MIRQRLPSAVVMLLLCAPVPSSWCAAPPGPVEAFIRFPAYDTVSLSPGGSYLAVGHRGDDAEFLSVFRLPGLELVSSTRFSDDLGIDRLVWATEQRLLIQPARQFPTRDDYRLPTGEIAAMDVGGGNRDMLYGVRAGIGQLGVKARKRTSDRSWARIIHRLPDDPDHVLIQTMGYGREGIRNEALTLDVHDGVTRRVARSPVRNGQFVAGPAGAVDLVAGRNEAGDLEVHVRAADGSFRLAHRTELAGGTFYPVLPTEQPGYYVFADSVTGPTRGLVSWNPVTHDRREIFRHPDVDYARILVAPYPRIWAVGYVDHFPDYHYPDPGHPFVALQESLRAMFPGDDVSIVDQTDSLDLALAYASGPKNPGTYLLLDTRRSIVLERLENRPWLRDVALADMEPLEVTVRDGLTVRSYLTLPPAPVGDDPLPMIVLVHGGPHGVYDTWGFDWEAQLLASRGYAVLQVNYRGSGGRGQAFLEAGYGEWGTRMQDDITDTVRYVVAEGIADADRICIYGASYGGYSAMVGAYRDPDLYRCAVGYAGIYDLPLLFEQADMAAAEAGVNFLATTLGTDEADLRARSPVHHASKIQASTMLIHGRLDDRAPFDQARRMRQALIDAGRDPVWLVENREGHGFLDADNRLAMYRALLDFFAANLDR